MSKEKVGATTLECAALRTRIRAVMNSLQRLRKNFISGELQRAVDAFCKKRGLMFAARGESFTFWPQDKKLWKVFTSEEALFKIFFDQPRAAFLRWKKEALKDSIEEFAAGDGNCTRQEVLKAWQLLEDVYTMTSVLESPGPDGAALGNSLQDYPSKKEIKAAPQE